MPFNYQFITNTALQTIPVPHVQVTYTSHIVHACTVLRSNAEIKCQEFLVLEEELEDKKKKKKKKNNNNINITNHRKQEKKKMSNKPNSDMAGTVVDVTSTFRLRSGVGNCAM